MSRELRASISLSIPSNEIPYNYLMTLFITTCHHSSYGVIYNNRQLLIKIMLTLINSYVQLHAQF